MRREKERERERERERKKCLIDFRFTLLFLLMDIIFMRPSRTYIIMVAFRN